MLYNITKGFLIFLIYDITLYYWLMNEKSVQS